MIMKKNLLLLTLLLTNLLVMAQEDVTTYQLSKPAYGFRFSPDSQYVSIVFFNEKDNGKLATKGEIGIFDLNKNQLIFTKELNRKKEYFTFVNEGLLFYSSNNMQLFSKDDGKLVWNKEGYINGISKKGNLLFLSTMGSARSISTIRISDGTVCRKDKFPGQLISNLCVVAGIDETSTLFVGRELYLHNLTDGISKNGFELNYNANGVLPSVKIDADECVVNDTKKIYCFDKNLNLNWSADHPKACINTIIVGKDSVYLINYGYINGGLLFPQNKLTRPYIASFNRKSGEQLSFDYLSENKDALQAFRLHRDAHSLFAKLDGHMVYQKMDGSATVVKKWDESVYGKFNDISPVEVTYWYDRQANIFHPIELGADKCLVTAENGDTYILDTKLDIVDSHKDADSYFKMFGKGDVICVGRNCPDGDDFWLIDKTGKALRHFPDGTKNVLLAGNRVMYIAGETINWFTIDGFSK